MIDILLSVGLMAVLAGIVLVGWAARKTVIPSSVAAAVAAFCALALLAMLISDWPTGVLSVFWSEHAVLAAVLTNVFTVGFAFMAYEVHDLREQARLHRNLTAAGLGGMAEPMQAIRRAIELAAGDDPPDLSSQGRPLKWLLAADLTSTGPVAGSLGPEEWRTKLIDQAIRRLATTMRDWGPLVSSSRHGLEVLEDMGRLRLALMRLHARADTDPSLVWRRADDLAGRVTSGSAASA